MGESLTVQEVHIIHPFAHDFYGHDMSVLVLGFIRPELDYVSKGQSRLFPVPLSITPKSSHSLTLVEADSFVC